MSDPCLFCSIPPDRLVLQEQDYSVIWDAYPVSPGHALVIPRRHIPTWFEATHQEQAALVEGIEKARAAILQSFSPQGFNIGINIGEAAGQTVFHLHIHIIPRYAGDVPDPRGGVRYVIPAKANYKAATATLPNAPHSRAIIRGTDKDPLLPHLLAHLDRAVRADICVAFVQPSGMNLVEEHLRDLLARGGRLRFLTGDYMDITDPVALFRLLDLDGNSEVRVFETRSSSFHPKSYIFHFPDGTSTALVGSSNLTGTALQNGIEWNYRVITSADARGLSQVQEAFEQLFQHPATQPVTDAWIQSYIARRKPRQTGDSGTVTEAPEAPPPPHSIQLEALAALVQTREAGNTAGMVVLATGLGKTWLSAFDSHRPEFSRVLFVAHREEILGQAMRTFRRVRPNATFGRFDGAEKLPDADILFASVQTLGRQAHLRKFDRARFDYIVVDEFHHASARTYRNLIAHFTPRFLLGLTATPERTDGGDLLALCQENLVYRCDMFRGIEVNLLSPFHYFGVPDEVDYRNIPWRSNRFDEEELTKAVATQKRAANILEQYRTRAGSRTLAFCCSQRHCDFMADYFNDRGIPSASVHSGPGSAPRAASLEALRAGQLKLVFAVDMLNEGVDLPNIDTVMMLRPTESSILWLQQFGRGLRKTAEKPHLNVIDYIGNHRIFLNKPRTLLALAAGDHQIDRALNLLLAGKFALPPGCEVTYELGAVEIIKSLLRSPTDTEALRAYYLDFKERHGTRPTASELFHEGYTPRSLRPSFGSWLGFVDSMGDLSEAQRQALTQARDFLASLEATPMTKSFKMLTLLGMLNEDAFPGSLSLEDLAEAFARLARRSATLRRDVGPALDNRPELLRLLKENPVAAWTGGRGTGDRQFFTFESGQFSSRITVAPGSREPLQELTRELAEWRLAEYLTRPGVDQASPEAFSCKVSHSSGSPILFLPDRATHPHIPNGWTSVRTDSGNYEANFVKIAVNVLRQPGHDTNILAPTLTKWFGPDAGRPGTNFHVVFEPDNGALRMRPANDRAGQGTAP